MALGTLPQFGQWVAEQDPLVELRRRFGPYFAEEKSLLEQVIEERKSSNTEALKILQEQRSTDEASFARQEQMLAEMAKSRKQSGKQFGLGLVTDILGGWLVDRAYDKELEKQQDRFEHDLAPILRLPSTATDEMGKQITAFQRNDLHGGIVSGVASTGRSARTAAKAQAGLSPGGEGTLDRAAFQYISGEIAGARQAASIGRARREGFLLEGTAAKFGLDVREKQSAIKAAAEGWDSTYEAAERKAAEMAAAIDAISSIVNVGMMLYLGAPALPSGGGGRLAR